MTTQPIRAGVVGLGSMGLGIAASLVRAGIETWGFDPNPTAGKAFADKGGHVAASPAEVGAQADVLFCVVVNAAQAEAALLGEAGAVGAMAPGSVVVQCATCAPDAVRALARPILEAGLLFIDGPISGGAAKAATGEITVMASGDPAAFAKARPAFDAVAAKVFDLGPEIGAGSQVKLVNQLLAGVHIAAAAEAMAYGISGGCDPKALFEVITASAGNSWMFENRVPHILDDDYVPRSAVDIFVKDLGLVHGSAHARKFPLPLTAQALQMFTQASAMGLGREDDAAVVKIFPGVALPSRDGKDPA
ncbi:3-hydroxyisobutyrate dehydrogenase [Aureimonas phyllosphaerae]|uniref:L-threonate dehydrogenase n=2 Tax=Aureimonas phyllosphaerae TaxID=1166078 RepID=A0A7W6C161_9HYPH|nr:L-threonate dehydrogenase [Aureimonas phyllosphaerae]MBB3936537.1 3-hydroxyisobutyrate dehydrogenase [Aureimonas phyllosphaerae]MBB3960599.1 3-hydroxyisobutyrate dehydrogenase [Aureimonas phyllosphaerae]SFF28913.1 3-hydroxyisobutyrate dehydrogenase [Aureimonas phyllosphaerae]